MHALQRRSLPHCIADRRKRPFARAVGDDRDFDASDLVAIDARHLLARRGGRGLAQGRIYTQSADLVASVAQEIMVRVPSPA